MLSTKEKNEQYRHLVVKNNDLIQRARLNLTAQQQKFISYAISLIKPDDREFQFYEIRVDEYCELMGINKDWFYKEFMEMVNELDNDNNSLWIETEEKIFKFRWFSEIEYIKGRGTARVMFNSNLKKYLLNQTERFTQYELYNIVALKSKYSHALFELLKSHAFRGGVRMTVEELKYFLGLNDENTKKSSYDNFSNIRRRILDPVKTEINNYTELTIDYTPITKGRKVTEIDFSVKRKTTIGQYSSYVNTMDHISDQIEGQLTMTFEEYKEKTPQNTRNVKN